MQSGRKAPGAQSSVGLFLHGDRHGHHRERLRLHALILQTLVATVLGSAESFARSVSRRPFGLVALALSRLLFTWQWSPGPLHRHPSALVVRAESAARSDHAARIRPRCIRAEPFRPCVPSTCSGALCVGQVT